MGLRPLFFEGNKMTAPKKTKKEYVALKTLSPSEGVTVKKGNPFTCSDEVYKQLKKAKAVE